MSDKLEILPRLFVRLAEACGWLSDVRADVIRGYLLATRPHPDPSYPSFASDIVTPLVTADGDSELAKPSPYRMTHRVRVFISYSREDSNHVAALRMKLQDYGVDVWTGSEQVHPDEDWSDEVRRALEQSDLAIFCFSARTFSRPGYVQMEFKYAMEVAERRSSTFIVPVRLDESPLPPEFRRLELVEVLDVSDTDELVRDVVSKSASED